MNLQQVNIRLFLVFSSKDLFNLDSNKYLQFLHMQLSQQSSSKESQIVYQEEQVVWAKVRGYPWWPAYVDKIGGLNQDDELEYTVYFFGDDMHSVLGASKLRRFGQHYAQFYTFAKNNRKLMISIQKAQQRLKQNDQNVEIYETLRNSLTKKKTKKRKTNQNSSQKQNSGYSSQQKKAKQIKVSSFNVEQQEVEDKQSQRVDQSQKIQKRQRKSKKKFLKQNRRNKRQKIEPKKSQKISQKEQIDESQIHVKEQKEQLQDQSKQADKQIKFNGKQMLQQQDLALVRNKIHETHVQQNVKSPSSPKMSQIESEEFQMSNNETYNKKQLNKGNIRNNIKRGQLRKRGRPKKIMQKIEKQKQEISTSRVQQKTKMIKKIDKQQQNLKVLQKEKQVIKSNKYLQILSRIAQLRDNRQQLIAYLHKIQITPGNIKPILDLNVSQIIQKEPCTMSAINLLQIFKTTLLRKYFPDDLRYVKKYESLMKKKKKLMLDQQRNKRDEMMEQQQDEEEQSDKEQQSKENINQNKVQLNQQFSMNEILEIRRKTVNKLQKFLKRQGFQDPQVHEKAIKIQSFFEQIDSGIGLKYRQIAFKVLTCLKEKQLNSDKIIEKLVAKSFQ